MKPKTFVAKLKAEVREEAEAEIGYFARPPSDNPPKHMARFSAWFHRLSPSDRRVARDLIQYAMEGSLFGLLTILDNIATLSSEGGEFELWHISRRGVRTRLNDPEGDLLSELFNNSP